MGLILAKFRKKKMSAEILENIDKEIKSIEDFRRNTLERHKKIVGHFLIFSIGVYLVSCILFYFYFYSPNIKERIFYFLPLLVAPVFIFSLKRLLAWYYNRKISKKEVKLVSLKNEKKKLLDTVMETETYKVARTILEKYAPEQVRKVTLPSSEMTPMVARSPGLGMQSGLRNRSMQNRSSQMMRQSIGFQTPARPVFGDVTKQRNNAVLASADTSQAMPANSGQIVPVVTMPRAILPKDRSVLQKMVEYLVGDGPYNRYALICKECYGHNGMALQEEYEYMSYRCCYCQVLNPARKKKPAAPKLGFDIPPASSGVDDDETSESEKNSGSDTDSEGTKKPDGETLSNNNKEKSSDNEQPSDFDKLSDLDTKNSDGEQVEVQEEEEAKKEE